jgi:dihydropyrimidinase
MKQFDLLIQGGTIVNATGQTSADVAVRDGRIVGIGSFSPDSAQQTIDATHLLVMPGMIDPHVHFDTPIMGTVTRHDFHTGGIMAAAGGVTTIVDFAFQEKGKTMMEAVYARKAQAEGNASIDYSFHAIFTDVNHETVHELPDLVRAGISSWKVFMAYRRLGFMVDDGGLLALLQASSDLPLVGIAHPENASLIEFLIDKFVAEGKVEPKYHARSRPPIAEGEAVARASMLVGETGTPFYFFHLSSAAALEALDKAKANGWPLYAETCPHYLLLDESLYDQSNGQNWCMSPPLRPQSDRDAMWKAVASGLVDIVSSDDGAFDAESKARGKHSFDLIPNGIPGAECRLSLMWSEGVEKGRISAERLVAVCSTNAARLLGMYPRKGIIAIGSDADIVLFDPKAEKTLSLDTSHMRAGYHPYEGMHVRGLPVTTILRGKTIFQKDQFVGEKGGGRFIERHFNKETFQRVTL